MNDSISCNHPATKVGLTVDGLYCYGCHKVLCKGDFDSVSYVTTPTMSSGTESILEEAQRLTHGDRQKQYGPAADDYTRTAALVNALLNLSLTAHQMALIMCCVKLSREIHSPKRDNMVDLAGYAWVAHSCLTPKEI